MIKKSFCHRRSAGALSVNAYVRVAPPGRPVLGTTAPESIMRARALRRILMRTWVLRRDITRAWARRVALRLGARRRMSHSKGARSSLRLGAKADIDLCAQGHQLRSRIARVSASTNQVQSNSNNLIGLIDAQNFSKETQISLS